MNQLFQMILIYLGVLVLLMFFINLFTKGFLFKYLIARGGKRRGKVLLIVDAKYFSYIKTGVLIEGWLTYKDREKRTRRISVKDEKKRDCATDYLGCILLMVNEELDCVYKKDLHGVTGHDGQHCEDLYQRALNRSKLNDYKKSLQIIMLIVGFNTLLLIVALVMISGAKKSILAQMHYCDLRILGNTTQEIVNNIAGGAGNVIAGGNMI